MAEGVPATRPSSPACSTSPTTSSARGSPARSCATTATTPTWWWRRTRARRPSPTSPTASRRTTGSGSATPSPRGGSVGYDHKAMGITARGAWSVRRHFRERGIDCQTEDFTCVGIGEHVRRRLRQRDAALEHTELVAAFDHRDIFLDPDPDSETSYAERRRLFDLPRSSWRDYDKSLISEGGGSTPRRSRSRCRRRWCSLEDDVTSMTQPS